MNFYHHKNLQESIDGMKKIFSISWSQNFKKLAVAHVDEKRNVRVTLFDEEGERKDSFPTRPANKNNKSYVVKDIAFSPDSTKIAVSQSDSIVFVYNLGLNWGEKKNICNKFEQSSQVSCLKWPFLRPNEIFFGVGEGKVKVGNLKTNLAQVLYSTDSYILSIDLSIDCKHLISGHIDNSIYKFNIEIGHLTKISQYSCIPYCIGYTNDEIFIAGNDQKVSFLSQHSGELITTFDYSKDETYKDFICCKVNQTGDCVAVGNFNRFIVYYKNISNKWTEGFNVYIENLYTVTAIEWKPDNSSLVIGNLCGSIDIFESCLKKYIHKEKFEFSFLSESNILIKNLSSNKRLNFKSSTITIPRIEKISIQKDNYIIITTQDKLIIGSINLGLFSEINLILNGNEIFDFNNDKICMIYCQGDVNFIEYGINEVIGTCKSDIDKLNSIIIKSFKQVQSKILVYLVDSYTVNISNLTEGNVLFSVNHNTAIESIKISPNGVKLLICDINKTLTLVNTQTNNKIILLENVLFYYYSNSYDILIAQSNNIKYIILYPEDINYIVKSSLKEIKGITSKLKEIREEDDKIIIIQQIDNTEEITYVDDFFIIFCQHIESNNIKKAISLICDFNINNSSLWEYMTKLCLEKKEIYFLYQCYGMLNNFPKTKYVKGIINDIEHLGPNHPIIEAKMYLLQKDFIKAENILIKNNLIKEAYNLFNEVQKYEISYEIALRYNFSDLKEIHTVYYKSLIDKGEYEKASCLLLKEGKGVEAIKLLTVNGFYAKAANLILKHNIKIVSNDILQILYDKLLECKLYNNIADLKLLYSNDSNDTTVNDNIINLYILGNNFSKAKELSLKLRSEQFHPKYIEEIWGDYLFNKGDYEYAIVHYNESNLIKKSFNSLLKLNRLSKAESFVKDNIKLLDSIEINSIYEALSTSYLNENNIVKCIEYMILSNCFKLIINSIAFENKYSYLERIFVQLKNNKDKSSFETFKLLLIEKIKSNEIDNKTSQRILLLINQEDLLILNYIENNQISKAIELIDKYSTYEKYDYYNKILKMLYKQCSINDNQESLLLQISTVSLNYYYICEFYLEKTNYEQFFIYLQKEIKSIDYFNTSVDSKEANRITLEKKKSLLDLIENNIDLIKANSMYLNIIVLELKNLGIYDIAVKILCDCDLFSQAEDLLNNIPNNNVIYEYLCYKKACKYKSNGDCKQAKEYYIISKKYKEAINMFIEIEDYENALLIANNYLEQSEVELIHQSQGFWYSRKNNFKLAEEAFVNANCPEKMIEIYIKKNLKNEAKIFSEKYSINCLENNTSNDYIQTRDAIIEPETSELVFNKQGISSESSDTADSKFNNSFKNTLSLVLDSNSLQNIVNMTKLLTKSEKYLEASELLLSIQDLYSRGYTKITLTNEKLIEYLNLSSKYFFKIVSYKKTRNYILIGEEIASRYLNFQEYIKAYDVYLKINKIESALNSLILGNKIEEAKDFINNKLNKIITNRNKYEEYKIKFLKVLNSNTEQANKDIKEQINIENEIQELFNNNDYISLIKLICNFGNKEMFDKYFNKIVSNLIYNRKYFYLCEFLLKVKFTFDIKALELIKDISYEILAEENFEELEILKFVFTKYNTAMMKAVKDIKSENIFEVERLMIISHFQYLKFLIKPHKDKLGLIYERINLTLMKYTDIIKYDVVLYDLCNLNSNMNNNTNIFFTRYDHCFEAIKSNNFSNLNKNFESFSNLDFVKENYFLSKENIISEEEKEKIKFKKVEFDQLTVRKIHCENCNTEVPDCNSSCFNCNFTFITCSLSGQSINLNNDNITDCLKCNKVFVKKYLEDFLTIFNFCPYCLVQLINE